MNSIQNHLVSASSLFRALDAAKNWRAMGLLIATSISALIVASLFGYIASRFGINGHGTLTLITGGIGALLSSVVLFTGFSSVGILLMDQIKSNPPRALSNTLFVGLATLPSFLGLVMLEFVVAISIVVILAIVLFICKIPVIGPLLYTFVYPIMVVIIGVVYFSLVFVVNPLAAPSIWDGNNVMQSIAKLGQLGKSALLPVALNQLVLDLMVAVVAGILSLIAGIGISFASRLSSMILSSGQNNSMIGMIQGLSGMITGGSTGEVGGYVMGYMFGSVILFSIVISIPMLILISGNCLIFMQYARNIDTAEIEEKIRGGVVAMKDKANAAREQLKQAKAPISNSLACPNCHSAIFSADLFCGGCGEKLK